MIPELGFWLITIFFLCSAEFGEVLGEFLAVCRVLVGPELLERPNVIGTFN